MICFQVNADRSKDAVFDDIEKIMDVWVGIHKESDYVVLCHECNRNMESICKHNIKELAK